MARKPPVHWQPGTEAKLSYTDSGVPPWPNGIPAAGDLLASEAGGAWVIEEVRQSKSNPRRLNLLVVRLEYGSIELDDEGVWPLYWQRRSS